MNRALFPGADSPEPIEHLSIDSLDAQAGLLASIGRGRLTFGEEAAGVPESLIVKLASPLRRNRLVCTVLSLYRREYVYYARLARDLAVPSPKMYYGDFLRPSSRFVLVLEDLDPAQVVDQIAGPDPAQAHAAVKAIARMHARHWNITGRASLPGVLDNAAPGTRRLNQIIYRASLRRALERTEDLLSERSRRLMADYGPRLAAHQGDYPLGMRTFVHGDYRAENLLFAGDGAGELSIIDWQASGLGGALYDMSYFLSGSLPIEMRRRLEKELLAAYHAELRRAGVQHYSVEDCWNGYRNSMLANLLPVVAAWGSLDTTDERMATALRATTERIMTALDDVEAHEFLPG